MAVKSKKDKKTKKSQPNVKDLKQSLKDLKSDIQNLKDKNIRLLAEFDNYKKRTINEKDNLRKFSGEFIIKDLLSAFDDLDRIKNSDKKVNISKVIEGIELVKKNIVTILDDHGIEKYESIGKEFNPDFHDAISNEPGDTDNIVTQEFQAGYIYHDKVIRHAKVVVSKVQN
tara:strand:+ start:1511 stop:2023 length:513 start_codon:yes stop_codon:yes gene_type:complete